MLLAYNFDIKMNTKIINLSNNSNVSCEMYMKNNISLIEQTLAKLSVDISPLFLCRYT